MLVSRKLRHCFTYIKLADAKEFLSVFGEFVCIYVIFGDIFNEIFEKMHENDHT